MLWIQSCKLQHTWPRIALDKVTLWMTVSHTGFYAGQNYCQSHVLVDTWSNVKFEPSTRNGNIWPTRKRQHHQYLKISCWRWRCCAAERWTKLRQLTRQACRVITVVAIFWLVAFKSDPGQCSCGNICNRLEKSGACPCLIQIQQDIFRYWRCCLLAGRPNFAVSRGKFNPIQCPFKAVYKL